MHVCICLCLFVQCSLSKSRLSPEVEAFITLCPWASLVAQLVKNPPTRQKTWVWSLGWEDPLEKGTATHSSILTWRILWAVQSMGSQRVGHEWAIFTFTLSLLCGERWVEIRVGIWGSAGALQGKCWRGGDWRWEKRPWKRIRCAL